MDYKSYNDYELIYMVRERDDSSYGTLFHKYLPVINGIAREFYVKFSDYGCDYSDFVQEAYIAFQNAIATFNEEKDTLFYTYADICIRRALSTFCYRITCSSKNTSVYNFIDINEIVDDADLVSCDDIAIYEDNMEVKDIMRRVWDIVYDFDDILYSSVFELKQNDFKYSEISELLDISPYEALTIQRKVRKAIRQKFEFNL